MKHPKQLTAALTAAAAAGALLGIPALSPGADPCAALPDSAARSACQHVPVPSAASDLLGGRHERAAAPRQTTTDQATNPPLHGTSPHGQGTVAVIDTNPDPSRPYSDDPTGKQDNEDVVVGRSRGEQRPDGSYHGHITIAAVLGSELLGVDTDPGETQHGPLDAVQTNILDALCDGSNNQICLQAATADSATTGSGSTNHFGVAHATLGGAQGIDAGVAESNGNISSDGTCQTSHGDSSVADVKAGGQAVATAAKSSSDSKACRGGAAPEQSNTSSVVGLGGTGVPIPAPGCADGTPDTVTGIPTLLPIVCNADDTNGAQAGAPYGVREALDAFVLATGATSVAKLMVAGADSRAVAPAAAGGGEQCSDGIDNDGDGLIDAADPDCHTDGNPGNPDSYNPGGTEGGAQCADGKDNDGDGLVDAADPGCHTDGNANNPASYDASDNDETNGGGGTKGTGGENGTECSDGKDNDGDGLIDANDPGCHSDGNADNAASYNPGDDSEAGGGNQGSGGNGAPACSDGIDNDGDGVSDAADPGCHSDGNAGNAASYVPSDTSELNGSGVAGATAQQATLPMTGDDVVRGALIGALLLAAGLMLRLPGRRRAGDH